MRAIGGSERAGFARNSRKLEQNSRMELAVDEEQGASLELVADLRPTCFRFIREQKLRAETIRQNCPISRAARYVPSHLIDKREENERDLPVRERSAGSDPPRNLER